METAQAVWMKNSNLWGGRDETSPKVPLSLKLFCWSSTTAGLRGLDVQVPLFTKPISLLPWQQPLWMSPRQHRLDMAHCCCPASPQMSTGCEIMVTASVLATTGTLLFTRAKSSGSTVYIQQVPFFFFFNHKDLAFLPWIHSQKILLLMVSIPHRPDGETLLLRGFPEPWNQWMTIHLSLCLLQAVP